MRKEIKFMSDVAKDIIIFNNTRKDITMKMAMKSFYSIMKKYGIKQGTWNKNGSGRIINNSEWTMCKTLFLQVHFDNIKLQDMFEDDMPKELMAYGRKPKLKI